MEMDRHIREHGKRLYGLCRHLCGNAADADDLYQETWLRAVKGFSRFDPSMDFEPWITRICVNAYRSSLRRISRRLAVEPPGEKKEAMLLSAPAPEEPDYGALRAAVGKLPEKLRVTVVLFYFEDMDVASTAAVLGVPPGTVKSRLSKARMLLREELKDEPDLRF